MCHMSLLHVCVCSIYERVCVCVCDSQKDIDLWEALERVQLKELVEELDGKLDAHVAGERERERES